MLGAVAAGQTGGGYDSLAEAARRMAPPPAKVYRPLARAPGAVQHPLR